MTGAEPPHSALRVGVVLEQALAPVPGGTGRYSVELAAALARLSGAPSVSGWVAWHADTTAARIPGVSGPRRLPLPRRGLVAAWERGTGPAPRGVDVVHAPTPLFPPARGRPLVVTVHDTVPWTHPDLLTARGARWHRAMIERAARHAAAVTVPTEAVADDLTERVAGLSRDRVHALGAGVAPSLLAEPDAGHAARVGAAYPSGFVLSVATLEPRKGLDVLIAALAQLGADAPPLVLVGQPGWGGVDPVALAAASGVPDGRVRVAGRVPDTDLAVLLRAADAVIVPSRAEGFGLPVIEAMAAGTPVICTDVPALVEVSGGAALVVPAGDAAALAQALRDTAADDARAPLIEAGRARAAHYTWDAVAARTYALYRALLGRPA